MTQPAPLLSIIVVSFNTRDLTLACLDSVLEQTRATPYELLVIDNASSDGSAEAIAARFPALGLIRSEVNHGFARANNLAAEAAQGEFLLLLNPDTLVLDGAIDRLMAAARARPAAGIWGGRTRFADGSLNPTCVWRDMTLWSLFCHATGLARAFRGSALFNPEAYGGWPRDTAREVDIVSGCFFLITRALWQRLGGFDARFRMYAEEADLCRRARALGARPFFTPEAEIVHYGGASEKVRADKIVRLYAAKIALMDKHWSAPAAWAGRRLFGLAAGLRALAGRAAWAEVWGRRAEWLPGLPPVKAGAARPGA